MKKILPYALATSIIATGFASTTVSVDVSAASSYKLVKNKLVHSKTGKAVKNHAIYKNKLYKNGKLVTKTTVYNKFLFKKGSLVTKATVHNKQLFHKGKLATGNDLHNKTLYVNGKISSDIVKYNKQFYKAGKKVSANFKFIYNGKVYKGNTVDTNFEFQNKNLIYKEKNFTGFINGAFYYDSSEFNSLINPNVLYSNSGKSITLIIDLPSEEMFKFNIKDIHINNGAFVESVAYKKDSEGINKLTLTLAKTKMNQEYNLKVKNVSFSEYSGVSFEEQFSGLTNKILASEDYKSLKKYYDQYDTAAKITALSKNKKDFNEFTEVIEANFNAYGLDSNIYSPRYIAEVSLASLLMEQVDDALYN